MARPRQPAIRASVKAWANAAGMHHETLARKLAAAGIALEAGERPTAEQVLRTLLGDPAQARAAKTRAEAELLEMKRAEKAAELVKLDDVLGMIGKAFLPARQAFLTLPYEMAGRVGAVDTREAREALHVWVDRKLATLRAGLPEHLTNAPAWIAAEARQTGRPKAKARKRKKA